MAEHEVLFRIGVHGQPTKKGYYLCWYGKQKYGPTVNYWDGEKWVANHWSNVVALFGLKQDYWADIDKQPKSVEEAKELKERYSNVYGD